MPDFELERKYLKTNHRSSICGVDEVGRGALFGPVVAAAVILDPDNLDWRLNDSKKLSESRRLELAASIYQNSRAYSIGWVWNDMIDTLNILEATKKAMMMAIKNLQIFPDYVLMDGMKPDFLGISGEAVIKGDSISLSIAAASIIAKVFRDQSISNFSQFFPEYDLANNKGYPTKKHKESIHIHGQTFFHRRSFRIKGWQKTKEQV